VYVSQGGFVGFLSGVGRTNYVVRYWTPYLSEGLLISLAGFSIFGGVIGATFFVDKKRKEQEN
jgi:prolipoprotein diacylglyceryltransferase